MMTKHQDASNRQDRMKGVAACNTGASVLTFVKDLCGTDTMHLITQQCQPSYITVQLSNYYDKLKKKCLFSLFFTFSI